ncbi:MAG: HEAT repeat domain-containing protein, partial [Isosphaeraceae bacterium]
ERSGLARRIKGWRDAIAMGSEDRRREAETQLMELRDPAAVEPLLRVLGNDEEPFRKLLTTVLGAIPGPESAGGLVRLLLREDSADVRGSIMIELRRKEEPEATKDLIKALASKDPTVVNRAAWGLGNLGAVTAVPSLVNALFTRYTRMELPNPTRLRPSMVNPGAGPSLPPAAFGPTFSPPPIAYNGSSVAYLTGPVVAPGAVAFGATSAPVVPLPSGPLPGITNPGAFFNGPSMSGLNLSASGLGGARGPVPRPVTYSFRNTEVLAALVKLTGQDFGFDMAGWKNWVRSDYRPEPSPARTVPQP